jgi:hypothetical protein
MGFELEQIPRNFVDTVCGGTLAFFAHERDGTVCPASERVQSSRLGARKIDRHAHKFDVIPSRIALGPVLEASAAPFILEAAKASLALQPQTTNGQRVAPPHVLGESVPVFGALGTLGAFPADHHRAPNKQSHSHCAANEQHTP